MPVFQALDTVYVDRGKLVALLESLFPGESREIKVNMFAARAETF